MNSPVRAEVEVWRVELEPDGGRAEARAALGRILAIALGEPDPPALAVGENGKPRLAVEPGRLAFNLSHSGGLALVAVAAGGVEVGVDVERLRPRRDLVRLAARWLPEEDAAAVAAASDEEREAVFYAAWTRHEARTKCTGAGLSGASPASSVVAAALTIDARYAAAIAWDTAAGRAAPAADAVDRDPIFVRRFEFTA